MAGGKELGIAGGVFLGVPVGELAEPIVRYLRTVSGAHDDFDLSDAGDVLRASNFLVKAGVSNDDPSRLDDEFGYLVDFLVLICLCLICDLGLLKVLKVSLKNL